MHYKCLTCLDFIFKLAPIHFHLFVMEEHSHEPLELLKTEDVEGLSVEEFYEKLGDKPLILTKEAKKNFVELVLAEFKKRIVNDNLGQND